LQDPGGVETMKLDGHDIHSGLVDLTIGPGGCFDTSKATNHSDPTFIVEGRARYGLANIPGTNAKTSIFVFTNAPALTTWGNPLFKEKRR
jgi:alanine dehydrogenase